jgi:hypothetical protein
LRAVLTMLSTAGGEGFSFGLLYSASNLTINPCPRSYYLRLEVLKTPAKKTAMRITSLSSLKVPQKPLESFSSDSYFVLDDQVRAL